jgi:glucose-1-phosphate adenylyltransferase
MMRRVVAVVLGGGRGTRLRPLTEYRSKPAVPLAGKYRLIDIPLSNCINSGLNRIYVLTQFMSVSLHRHIRGTYNFDIFDGGFVEILAAQQTFEKSDRHWFEGTADAVRKNLRYLVQSGTDYVLILSGDQLYRMDFRAMLATHEKSGASVTIAAKPVGRSEASELGIMRVDESGRVVGFLEKPKTEQELNDVAMDPKWFHSQGVAPGERDCLASMGIYLFNIEALEAALSKTNYQDFGREVFPASIRTRHVQVHLFDDYWEDIGTINSFYQANLQMARANAPFDLASATAPIYTRPRFLPPTRSEGVSIQQSLVADGCVIESGARIENSVIGLRCRIGRDVVIRDSIIMGNDYYETPGQIAANHKAGIPEIGIGAGAVVERAIVDKNCRIGPGARIVDQEQRDEFTAADGCVVRDGVLVVPKNQVIPDRWSL